MQFRICSVKSAAQRAARFQVAAPVHACRSENCDRRTRPCRANVEVARLHRGASPIRATVQAPIHATGARTPDTRLSASGPVRAPTGAPRSNVDFRCCASGNSPLSIAGPRAQSCGSLPTEALLARSRLRHRAADGPGNFFARDEPVRIAAAWIYDVFADFQIVKTTGVPAVGTHHREEPINTLHNFARLHFLCTISTEAAKFIVRVAKS